MALGIGLLEVIELAYQAATEPRLWPKVLESVADKVGGQGAIALYLAPSPSRLPVSARIDPAAAQLYFKDFESLNPIQAVTRRAGERRLAEQSVTTDQTWVAKDDLTASPFYAEFLSGFDMHAFLMIRLDVEVDRPTINIVRSRRAGDFDALEIEIGVALQAPLSRAWRLGQRLGAERQIDEGLAGFTERSAAAVILADAQGRIVHANAAAAVLLAGADGLYARPDGLRAATAEASRGLARLLGRAAGADSAPAVSGAMSIPRPSGRRPLALLVSPVGMQSQPQMAGARLALICVVDPEQAISAPQDRLRDLFGLTAAEAKVAAELVAGHEPRVIAERFGVSLNTVRFHLARTMEKTQTTRQSDLVLLIFRTLQGPG